MGWMGYADTTTEAVAAARRQAATQRDATQWPHGTPSYAHVHGKRSHTSQGHMHVRYSKQAAGGGAAATSCRCPVTLVTQLPNGFADAVLQVTDAQG